ncbi:MAG TPA: hypothetical protein VKZ96_11695 [Thermomicrobiales bacterium]|nr:hypothetical protein [Thermomicrobiales bacterium]
MRRLRLLWVALIVASGSLWMLTPAAAVEPGESAFERTWTRTDLPVQANQAVRTWMWGPAAFTAAMEEPYTEGPGEVRIVQYFDKSRMEITTDPNVDPNSVWYVTNGLLVVELITGRLQYGNNDFAQFEPAEVNIAGDAGDPLAVTYAALAKRLDDEPTPVGTVITATVDENGNLEHSDFFGTEFGVTAGYYVPETNHTVATPFWEFMTSSGTIYQDGNYTEGQLFEDPFFATGYPISEAYWTVVQVGGTLTQVMLQCFERRCLTYTPSNPPEWQVEAGNVGQHYYRWRYQTDIPAEPPAPAGVETEPLGPALLLDWPVGNQGQATVSFGNQAPYPMTVTLDGPVARTIELPACDDCPIYTQSAPPGACREDIPWHDETLPPGNYRVHLSWSGSNTLPLAGPQTYVPDAQYGTCFFIVEGS